LAWEAILKNKVPYQVNLYGACEHGFAVRTDLTDRKKRFAKESAYYQAVRWFDEWVKDPNSKI
jgi:dienelactone hydrolase